MSVADRSSSEGIGAPTERMPWHVGSSWDLRPLETDGYGPLMGRGTLLALKVVGGALLGLALQRAYVFVHPSNGVHTIPAESAGLLLGAWACLSLAYRKRVIRLPEAADQTEGTDASYPRVLVDRSLNYADSSTGEATSRRSRFPGRRMSLPEPDVFVPDLVESTVVRERGQPAASG